MPRERWIDSLRPHVEANSAESFNFLCKWGRETGPFLFLSLASIPFVDTPWIVKYPVLSAARGNAQPVLIKTLNRKCGLRGEEVLVDDTSSSRSNGTFETLVLIDSMYALLIWLTRENCVPITIDYCCIRLVRDFWGDFFGSWNYLENIESVFRLINYIFNNQISEFGIGISCNNKFINGSLNFELIKENLILIF